MASIKPTIVVVDDSVTAISLYKMSANDLAIELLAFRSADEAMDYLHQRQPDLLFLDIVMPEKDGLTLLKELRGLPQHRHTPVIMVTSKDYDQDRAEARELGALEFLLKPLRMREIREVICRHTGAASKACGSA
jgi:DNA-binding response OmpR family regulator